MDYTDGFSKELELIGVGYRASATGQLLELSVGFSHPVVIMLPKEIKVSAVMEKGKNPMVKLESADKQLLGQVAAKIRSIRKPEPYKGKGIRYTDEYVRRKAGKTAAK
jgi:large subunit ribosomal protein L6